MIDQTTIVGTFIVIPGGVVKSYRKRYGRFAALNPIKLEGSNDCILPISVLADPAFAEVKPDLNNFTQREITRAELPIAEL